MDASGTNFRWLLFDPRTEETPVSEYKSMFPETDNYLEALRLLDLIHAEFTSDPTSAQCFDLRIVERVRQCIETRKRLERRGEVPPLLTEGKRS
jgi:hypothetical protein